MNKNPWMNFPFFGAPGMNLPHLMHPMQNMQNMPNMPNIPPNMNNINVNNINNNNIPKSFPPFPQMPFPFPSFHMLQNKKNRFQYSNLNKQEQISKTVIIKNMNSKASKKQLIDFFSDCGPIAYMKMAGDEAQPTRFAFIEFLDKKGADNAVNSSGKYFLNVQLRVNPSRTPIIRPTPKLSRDNENHVFYAKKIFIKKNY